MQRLHFRGVGVESPSCLSDPHHAVTLCIVGVSYIEHAYDVHRKFERNPTSIFCVFFVVKFRSSHGIDRQTDGATTDRRAGKTSNAHQDSRIINYTMVLTVCSDFRDTESQYGHLQLIR